MFLFTRFHIVDKKLVQLAQILFISSICSVFFLKYNQENLPTNYLVVLNRIINNVIYISFFVSLSFSMVTSLLIPSHSNTEEYADETHQLACS